MAKERGESIPEPTINTTGSVMTLLFVTSNSVVYDEPCDDPIFAAHSLVNETAKGMQSHFYISDQ